MTQVMNFAPFYEQIVQEYRADLYLKGEFEVKKKNLAFRYLPTLFPLRKGVRRYIAESVSDMHYTAPNIYDQKVKASIGTLPKNGRLEREILSYFHVNVYASTLLDNELLSPLAKNGKKYYKYRLDSVMGEPNNLQYKIRFIPRTKSDQLVGGYLVVSANLWCIREIRFSGRYKLTLFENYIRMGEVGDEREFLPVYYKFNMNFTFVGNQIEANYLANLAYNSIKLKEVKKHLKEQRRYDLTESYTLTCDTNSYSRDSTYFNSIRPIALTDSEHQLYLNHALQKDTTSGKPQSKNRVFWGEVGDLLLNDNHVNLSKVGSVRFSPIINPLLLSYSGNNGLSYRQEFKYNCLFNNDRLLRIVPRMGYNFTRKEFYWSVSSDLDYWPEKRGSIRLNLGNGNRIYSSDVLDDLKSIPDSLFDFNQVQLNYFRDLFFHFQHRLEISNGLEATVGLLAHRRTPVQLPQVRIDSDNSLLNDALSNVRDAYISFAPRVRIEWTPGLHYYMNGKRKINLHSRYPTFSLDWERGIKGVFNSTGAYERMEFDLQHKIPLGLMRNIYYRFGMGAFTNSQELYFVDFANFSRNNLPVGWNDEIGGVFQLLDGRWYNASRQYLRGHFTYEAPFLVLRHLMKYTRYVQNERLYLSTLYVPRLTPYVEIGYGIGTTAFDLGIFVGSEKFQNAEVGFKFTFELFNR